MLIWCQRDCLGIVPVSVVLGSEQGMEERGEAGDVDLS